jgi:hypothetical protein
MRRAIDEAGWLHLISLTRVNMAGSCGLSVATARMVNVQEYVRSRGIRMSWRNV